MAIQVRIFCIYSAVAVLMTYLFHVTFFGACMAYFGLAEAKNLHGLTLVPVMPKSVAMRQRKSWLYLTFCTGGRDPKDPEHPNDTADHAIMLFFRDVVAASLNKASVKALVIAVFLTYLGFGIYGCTLVKEGLDRRKLSRDDSYSVRYYDFEDRFFREYPYRIQIVINQTINYADPASQERMERILTRFESSQYMAPSALTESWLRAYLAFIKQEDSFLFLQSLNLTNQDDFYTGLKSIFLNLPMTENFRQDIRWNEDESEIVATRFVVQTKNIRDANMEKEMLLELRAIADEFRDDQLTIFNHLFIFFDQFILVREISLQTISVAALVMMAISVFFIPSISCALWVAFSIMSIEIGVVGYMTHWGVNLDSISMINLIMCIGFSVDFSAHISYSYMSCGETTAAGRVRTSLYLLGLPIFQGSVSTILGIIALAFAPSYVFVTFFKTVFLVMLFGATHGVLLLPVLLSLTDGCFGGSRASVKSSDSDTAIVAGAGAGAGAGGGGRSSGKQRQVHQLPDVHHRQQMQLPSPISRSLPAPDRLSQAKAKYHVNPCFQHDSHLCDLHCDPHAVGHRLQLSAQLPASPFHSATGGVSSRTLSLGAPIYIPRVAVLPLAPATVLPSSVSSSVAAPAKFLKYSSNWDGVGIEPDSGQETKTASPSSSLEAIDLGLGTSASGEELSESSDKVVRRKSHSSSHASERLARDRVLVSEHHRQHRLQQQHVDHKRADGRRATAATTTSVGNGRSSSSSGNIAAAAERLTRRRLE